MNNAGIVRDKTLLKMDESDFDSVIAVHLKGTFNCTRHAAEVMKEKGYGRIVNITSSAGLRGNFGQTNYGAAKAGIMGMTFVWAMELGRYGITVNAVAPAGATRMTAALYETSGKEPPPEENPALNAPLVAFLASEDAAHVNGQILGRTEYAYTLFQHPKQIAWMWKDGGWSAGEVAENFDAHPRPAPAAGRHGDAEVDGEVSSEPTCPLAARCRRRRLRAARRRRRPGARRRRPTASSTSIRMVGTDPARSRCRSVARRRSRSRSTSGARRPRRATSSTARGSGRCAGGARAPHALLEPWAGATVNSIETVRAFRAEAGDVRLLVDTGHVADWGGDPCELLDLADHVQLRQGKPGHTAAARRRPDGRRRLRRGVPHARAPRLPRQAQRRVLRPARARLAARRPGAVGLRPRRHLRIRSAARIRGAGPGRERQARGRACPRTRRGCRGSRR